MGWTGPKCEVAIHRVSLYSDPFAKHERPGQGATPPPPAVPSGLWAAQAVPLHELRYTVFRKTIATTLAVATATMVGLLTVTPAQAAVGGYSYGPRSGEVLHETGATYHHNGTDINYTAITFTLSGPNTDYRVYSGGFSGPNGIFYPGSNVLIVDGYVSPGAALCITEGTTGWRGCA